MIPVAGYHDRFVPGTTRWKSLLFKPSLSLQTAEMNEIQSMLRDEMEQFGQTLYERSAPVEGLNAVVDLDALTVTITAGKLYALGMIHAVESTVVPITGVGTELIAARLTPQVVTIAEDPTLRDPAIGAEGYEYEGADRLIYLATVEKVAEGENAYPIAELVNGQLTTKYQQVRPLWGKLIRYLEQRTYEESGHYLLAQPRIAITNSGTESLVFRVNDLDGYVSGRRVTVDSVPLAAPTSLAVQNTTAELHLYQSGTLRYALFNYPVRRVTLLTGRVPDTTPMTRGAIANGVDTVPSQFQPLAQVTSITQGATTYVAGVDFYVSGNSINWSLPGAEPAPGSTYTVNLQYVRSFVLQTMEYSGSGDKGNVANWTVVTPGDYLARNSFLDDAGEVDFYGTPTVVGADSGLDFRRDVVFTAAGVKPADGSEVSVSYDFTLPNYYVMAVDNNSLLYLSQGVPGVSPTLPSFGDSFLPFARFIVPAEATASNITTIYLDVVRLSMLDLQRMLSEIRTLQYNQAAFQLQYELIARDTPTDKRAVFADDFKDYVPSDVAHPAYAASLDTTKRAAYLPLDVEDTAPAGTTTTASYQDRSWTLPYVHAPFISQLFSNFAIQVNAYDYVNLGAKIVLDPPEDKFVAENFSVVDVYTQVNQVQNLPVHKIHNFQVVWLGMDKHARDNPNRRRNIELGRSTQVSTGVVVTNSTRVELANSTTDETISFLSHAREIEIEISGSRFIPGEEVGFTFSGTRLMVTPGVGYVEGIVNGTVLADINGNLLCTAFVPPNQVNDLHKIIAIGDGGPLATEGAGSYAEATYLSDARLRTVVTTNNYSRINTTTVTPTVTTTTVSRQFTIDPIAQTFLPELSTPLSAIGLWFKTKGTKPVQVLIVDTVNGIPTSNILASCTKEAADIQVSEDASLETLFEFDNFIYLTGGQEYAIVVKVDDAATQVWVSRFGAASGILKNPYTGVLLRSANARTWSAEQLLDLKFVAYAASFTANTATVNFNVTFTEPRSRFCITGTYFEPNEQTLVRWEYNAGNGWQSFYLDDIVELTQTVPTLAIRATLSGSALHSPIVNDDCFLRAARYELTGAYIAREFVVSSADIRYVDVWVDEYKPASTTVVPQVSFDSGATWQAMPHQAGEDRVLDASGAGLVERHYVYDSGSNLSLHTNVRVRLNFTSLDQAVSPYVQRLRTVARTI